MFRSKRRNLIFPQSEHLRLVGAIALHWGNAAFDRPALAFDSFVTGVSLHDLGHGYFDQNEVGMMDDAHRVRSMGNLMRAEIEDISAEIILQHHALRLMGDQPLYAELRPELVRKLESNLAQVDTPRAVFRWVDRITNLADMISFDFCFDRPMERTLSVFAKQTDRAQTDIHYQIKEGTIQLAPWLLRVDAVEGYIIGYQADVYPKQLKPELVRYQIVRGS